MEDIYMHVAGVQGDSEDSMNTGAIEVMSLSFGGTMPLSGSRSGAGSGAVADVSMSEVNISKLMDKSTVPLLGDNWTGKHYEKIFFKFYRSEAEQRVMYLEMMLEHVVISSYALSGGGDIPVESLSMNYGAISVKYTPTSKETGKAGGQPVIATYSRITKKRG